MGTTSLLIGRQLVRIGPQERSTLVAMGLHHAVVIAQDVSVRVKGAIDSVHLHSGDAIKEASRLSAVYDKPGAFIHVDLGKVG